MSLGSGRSLVKTNRGCEQSEDSVYLTLIKPPGTDTTMLITYPKHYVLYFGVEYIRVILIGGKKFSFCDQDWNISPTQTSRIFLRTQGLFRGSKIIIKNPFGKKNVTSRIPWLRSVIHVEISRGKLSLFHCCLPSFQSWAPRLVKASLKG